jgi:sec-independent protein translocase protein TatA
MGAVGLWGVVIIVALIVLLYGAKRLPDMARSLGRSSREFKDALAEAPEEFREGMSGDAARELESAKQSGGPTARELELEQELETERERRRSTEPRPSG